MRSALAPLVALPLVVGLTGAAPARDLEAVEIEAVPVAEGIHMLRGRGGNLGLAAGPQGAFLVDDQFGPLSGKIRAAVEELTARRIRFVVNTHWHGDHTGGNERLGRAGALIVAHDAVRRRLSTEQWNAARGETVPPSPREALPVITFSEEVTFHPEGHRIRVFHVPPAHTDGDAVVHFENANVIHAGDLLFNGSYPFIDLPAGGSLEGMIGAAGRLLELADDGTKIIPGHGPLADREDLAAFREMLVTARDRVRRLVEAGWSEEEAVAAKPTEDLDPQWGGGFLSGERFTRIAYRSLASD